MSKTVVDVLKEARALLAQPGVWVQGGAAFTAGGEPIDANDRRACRFCAIGACWRVGGKVDRTETDAPLAVRAVHALQDANGGPGISRWNDQQPSVEPVLDLFDKAIAMQEGQS